MEDYIWTMKPILQEKSISTCIVILGDMLQIERTSLNDRMGVIEWKGRKGEDAPSKIGNHGRCSYR